MVYVTICSVQYPEGYSWNSEKEGIKKLRDLSAQAHLISVPVHKGGLINLNGEDARLVRLWNATTFLNLLNLDQRLQGPDLCRMFCSVKSGNGETVETDRVWERYMADPAFRDQFFDPSQGGR